MLRVAVCEACNGDPDPDSTSSNQQTHRGTSISNLLRKFGKWKVKEWKDNMIDWGRLSLSAERGFHTVRVRGHRRLLRGHPTWLHGPGTGDDGGEGDVGEGSGSGARVGGVGG